MGGNSSVPEDPLCGRKGALGGVKMHTTSVACEEDGACRFGENEKGEEICWAEVGYERSKIDKKTGMYVTNSMHTFTERLMNKRYDRLEDMMRESDQQIKEGNYESRRRVTDENGKEYIETVFGGAKKRHRSKKRHWTRTDQKVAFKGSGGKSVVKTVWLDKASGELRVRKMVTRNGVKRAVYVALPKIQQ